MDEFTESTQNQEEELECRICRGGLEVGALLHPCKCAGSIRYVHEDCIKLWLQRTRAKTCELCHHSFKFSPVYAPDTPPRLPASIFLYGFIRIFGKHLLLLLRLGLVIFLWAIFLPIGTSWICRLFFLRSFQGLFLFKDRLQGGALVGDWMQGLLLSILVVGVFLAVSALRDYLVRIEANHEMLMDVQNFAQHAQVNPQIHAAPIHEQDNLAQQDNVALGEVVPAADYVASAEIDGTQDAAELREPESNLDVAIREPGDEQTEYFETTGSPSAKNSVDESADSSGRVEDGSNGVSESDLANTQDAARREIEEGVEGGEQPNGNAVDGGDIARQDLAPNEWDQELDRIEPGEGGGGGGGGVVRDEEVPLEEFLGLRGPIRHMVENAVTALVSNGLFIVGRLAIFLKVQLGTLFRISGTGSGIYSDGVTLLSGYVCIMLVVLELVLVSLLLGRRLEQTLLSPDSPLMRHLLSLVRYAFLLSKVGLLLGVELVLFPLCCGWLLDACALPLLHATWKERMDFAIAHPFAAQVLHWVLGVLFMLHLSVIVAVLREVLRPEVLWFLRNPADPDEHPFRDLVDEPLSKHTRRLILSLLLYAPLTALLVHVPALLIRGFLPDLLPLRLALYNPFVEGSMSLLLLHLTLPHLMDHFHPRDSFKLALELWLKLASSALGIRERLLPSQNVTPVASPRVQPAQAPAPPPQMPYGAGVGEAADRRALAVAAVVAGTVEAEGSGAVAEAGAAASSSSSAEVNAVGDEAAQSPQHIVLSNSSGAVQAGPKRVWLRVAALLVLAGLTSVVVVAATVTVPLVVGRAAMRPLAALVLPADSPPLMDVYPFALGFVLAAVCMELGVDVIRVMSGGNGAQSLWGAVARQLAAWWPVAVEVRQWRIRRAGNGLVMLAATVGVPLGMGLLLDATLGFLGRVSPWQSPALLPLAPLHWVVGLAALKSALRLLAPRLPLLGPDPFHAMAAAARRVVLNVGGGRAGEEAAASESLQIAGLVLRGVATAVCVPYAVLAGLLPAAGLDAEEGHAAWRALYPVAVGNLMLVAGGWRAARGLGRLHDAIRDSLYLVGRRLHNLE